MKVLFYYYKSLHYFNIPFSALLGCQGLLENNKVEGFLRGFTLAFFTGGFLLSVFFYGLKYEKRYYFYYNKGFSKIRLIGFSYLVNVALLLTYQLIKSFIV
jgi:hypothetical protein